MVMRYYGSKDGLFAAAADLDLHLPDLAAVPREQLGETLVRHWVELWEGGPSDELLIVLLQVGDHQRGGRRAAPDGLRRAGGQGRRRRRGRSAPRRRRGPGSSPTQMLGLALCRYILRLPPVVALDADTLIATRLRHGAALPHRPAHELNAVHQHVAPTAATITDARPIAGIRYRSADAARTTAASRGRVPPAAAAGGLATAALPGAGARPGARGRDAAGGDRRRLW